ncbi:MAG: ATP-binding protein [Hyphomicrobiaceae bacterium]|nr:ATP-binding protein [Hyphomicrobiaceae bacterium]
MAKNIMTEDDWLSLEWEIRQLFDGAPIDEEDLFAGRQKEVLRMLEAVMERSRHVVLYGEKGVGKTSLSNVFWKRFNKSLQSFVVARIQAGPQDNFTSLWVRALDELRASAQSSGKADLIPIDADYDVITPTEVRRELKKCSPNAIPIIIIDEYSEVCDADCRILTANTIKEFYDHTVTTTVILVGVAETIADLIEDHSSLDRTLVQISLNRMSHAELVEIIDKRASRTAITFSGDAKWTIILLSRGLPYFTQTLAKHAAFSAIRAKRLSVESFDVDQAMTAFIADSKEAFKKAYRDATRSNQDNNFEQSLLACALARTDDEGFFTANDVVEPFSAIMRDKKRIAHFEKHLRRFSSDEGGNVLIKRGGERQQRFRFKDPMMQPYVIIRGIESKMIDEDAKTILLQREQGVLPI